MLVSKLAIKFIEIGNMTRLSRRKSYEHPRTFRRGLGKFPTAPLRTKIYCLNFNVRI